jgi:molybdopterin-guanine dinucleotide biosynthesis protein A
VAILRQAQDDIGVEVNESIGVCILAGGEATRLPGKLSLGVGDVPMLVRVFRNVSRGRETWISTKGALPPELDVQIDAPRVVDRWQLRGPLSGLVSTMSEMPTTWVFAVAGDAPFVDAAFIDELAAHIASDVDAIVPQHAGAKKGIEPLAALYRREAFVRAGLAVLERGDGMMRLVIDQLRTKFIPPSDPRIFMNVNTPQDYDSLKGALR